MYLVAGVLLSGAIPVAALPGLRLVDFGTEGVFLGNSFLELGITRRDSSGFQDRPGFMTTRNAPASFFGRAENVFTEGDSGAVGILYAPDGFSEGDDNRIDFVLPGGRIEGYFFGANIIDDPSEGEYRDVDLFPDSIVISDVSVDPTVELIVRVECVTRDHFHLRQEVSLRENDLYFKTEVTIWHDIPTSEMLVRDVRYVRSQDPDSTRDHGGPYATRNTVNRHRTNGGADPVTAVSATTTSCDAFCRANGDQRATIFYVTADDRSFVDMGGNRVPRAEVFEYQDLPRDTTNSNHGYIAVGMEDTGPLPPYVQTVFVFYTVVGLGEPDDLIDAVVPEVLATARTESASAAPTSTPSAAPTVATLKPSVPPTEGPSASPTRSPSEEPSGAPSRRPTREPSAGPTMVRSEGPTASPSRSPSEEPSASPSRGPSVAASGGPTEVHSDVPTLEPSRAPSEPPSANPTRSPTLFESGIPTVTRSATPTALPSGRPTLVPSSRPSKEPSVVESSVPTVFHSDGPTSEPSSVPSADPTPAPTKRPSVFLSGLPTVTRSHSPTSVPSQSPTRVSSASPSEEPTGGPSSVPSLAPSVVASISPTSPPSAPPTPAPSAAPSHLPTVRDLVMLRQAVFTANGRALTIDFEGAVADAEEGSAFACDLVLDLDRYADEVCSWASTTRLSMAMNEFAESRVRPGDRISLRHGVFRPASCPEFEVEGGECPLNAQVSEVNAVAPADAVTPLVQLVVDQVASSCGVEDLLVDASGSLGGGGRALSFHFAFDLQDLGSEEAAYLAEVVAAHDGGGVLRLNPTRLSTERDFAVRVTATNFLGKSAVEGPEIFQRAVLDRYAARIRGARQETVFVNAQYTAAIEIQQPCGADGGFAVSNENDPWTVFEARDGVYVATNITSAASGQDSLVLAAFVLAPGTTYRIEYRATIDGFLVEAQKTLHTTKLALEALVGGCSQSASPPPEGSPRSVFHIIEYAGSYDPNLGRAASIAARDTVTATFNVSATGTADQIEPPACDLVADAVTLASAAGIATPKAWALNATAAAGCDVTVYIFLRSTSGLEASVECSVRVLPQLSPEVAIVTSLGAGVAKVDAGARFAVSANVRSSLGLGINATWSLSTGNLVGSEGLARASSTGVTASFPVTYFGNGGLGSTAPAPVNLVVRPGFLRERETYTLTLVAAYVVEAGTPIGTASAEASVTFVVNAAPRPGVFTIAPSNGTFEDLFALTASDWNDDVEDFPLTYRFRYRSGSGEREQLLNPTLSTANTLRLPLPPGAGPDHEGSARVDVADAFGAAAGLARTVVVRPGVGEEALDGATAVVDALDELVGDADADTVIQEFTRSTALTAVVVADDEVSVEDGQQLQLRLLDRFEAYLRATGLGTLTADLLETQLAWLALTSKLDTSSRDGSNATFVAAVTGRVLDIADLLVDAAGADATDAGPILNLGGATALLRALSDVAELAGDAELPRTYALITRLLQLRAKTYVAGDEPEVIAAANMVVSSQAGVYRGDVETAAHGGSGQESPGTSVGIGPGVFENGLGLANADSFTLGLVELPRSVFREVALESDAFVNESVTAATASLVSGVERLSVVVATDGDGEVSLTSGGIITYTQRLSNDVLQLMDAQCNELEVPAGQNCTTVFVCSLYDASTGAFEPQEECVGTPVPLEAPEFLECVCDYTDSGRRLQAAGEEDDATVTLDFGSMMVSSFSVVRGNIVNLRNAGSASPVMWAVVLGIAVAFFFFGFRADRMDKEDARTDATFARSLQSLHVWFAEADISSVLRRKLYAHGVRTIKDIDVLRCMSISEFFVAAARLGLDDAERHAMQLALFGPTGGSFAQGLFEKSKRPPRRATASTASGTDSEGVPRTREGAGRAAKTLTDMKASQEMKESPDGTDGAAETPVSPREVAAAATSPLRGAMGKVMMTLAFTGSTRSRPEPTATPSIARKCPKADSGSFAAKAAAPVEEQDDLWYGLRLVHGMDSLLEYEEKGLWHRILAAARESHDYYNALSLFPGDTPTRFVRVVRLTAVVCSVMIVNAIVYQVLYPQDQGFCSAFTEETSCEEEASSLNRAQNRCFFSSVDGCLPTAPAVTVSTVVIASALALIFVVPVQMLVDHLINEYLSDSPYCPSADATLSLTLSSKRDALRKMERKQADVLAEQELRFLSAHPECLPWFYRVAVHGSCGEGGLRFLLRKRVRAAAMEAAGLESELEPEHRMLHLELQAGHITYEEYLAAVRNRKVAVMKIAIRDALPFLKQRVFKRYTHLVGPSEVVPLLQRRVALAMVFAYIIGCLLYLIGFGVATSDDIALAWFLSFMVGEAATAIILMPLRVLVLGVVLPALIRQDVSIDRAIDFMPHYSAAGIFSRHRPDLVPGLRLLLDERHDRLAEETRAAAEGAALRGSSDFDFESLGPDAASDEVSSRTIDVSSPPAPSFQAPTSAPESGITLAQLVRIFAIAGDEGINERDRGASDESAMSPGEHATVPLDFLYERSDAPGVIMEHKRRRTTTRSSDSFEAGILQRARGVTLGPSGEGSGDAHRMLALMRDDLRDSRSPLASDGPPHGLRPHPSSGKGSHFAEYALPESATGSSEPSSSDGNEATPAVMQTTVRFSLPQGSMVAFADASVEGLVKQGSSNPRSLKTLEVDRHLRHRTCIMECLTAALLCVMALVVVLPEPLQSLLLEEGLPICFGFFLLTDMGMRVGNSFLVIFLRCLMLLAFMWLLLCLVMWVHRSIYRTLERMKEREAGPNAGDYHLRRGSGSAPMQQTLFVL